MYRHCQESHGGVKGPNGGLEDFTMKVTKTFQDPLTRILDEVVRIKDLEDNNNFMCLNTKEEYYQSQYIRITYSKGASMMYFALGELYN